MTDHGDINVQAAGFLVDDPSTATHARFITVSQPAASGNPLPAKEPTELESRFQKRPPSDGIRSL